MPRPVAPVGSPQLPGFTDRQWRGCDRAQRHALAGDTEMVAEWLAKCDVSDEQWQTYLEWLGTWDAKLAATSSVIPRYSAAPSVPFPTVPDRPLPTRCILHLPPTFDPVDGLGAALRIATEREPGVMWQPESVQQEATGWALTLAVEPDDQPGLQHVTLGVDVGPAAGPKVAAHLESVERQLISFDAYLHKATSAKLLPNVDKLRTQISAYLRVDPWEIQIAVRWKPSKNGEGPWEISTLTAIAASTMSADKRESQWLTIADDLIPQVPGTNWWLDDHPQQSKIVLRRAEDPLGDIGKYPWDDPISVNGVPFAVAADGHSVTIKLIEANHLLGGSPGSGKSGAITCLLAGISRIPAVALIGLDPKMVELSGWKKRFSYIATAESDISRVLGALVEEMEIRYSDLAEAGLKKITEEMLTDELPLLVLIIDELADLVSTGISKSDVAHDQTRATRIRRLIAKGRAAGIVVQAATQKPSSDVVPTSLRDLIVLRSCFQTGTPAMTDTVLGAGMSQSGGLSHEIPPELKGVCYVLDETERHPTRARCYWISDDQVAGLADETAHLRIDLPWLSATTPPYDSEIDGEPPAPRTARVTAPVVPDVATDLADVERDGDVGDDPWE